jgi:hypothetical protein
MTEFYLQESEPPTHEGCPVILKRRHIPVVKGVCGTAKWTMRKPDGTVVDLTTYEEVDDVSISESESISVEEETVPASIAVRFQGCDPHSKILGQVDATIEDAAKGIISFALPKKVCDNAGLYIFSAGIIPAGDTSPVFADGGLISVSPGLWGDTGHMTGPPTIEELRFALKDREEENDLLQAVEFDDAEILEAIRWPVFQFNERPPSLSTRYNCNNFPFRYYWTQAIIGRLLMMASHHYLRNKMQAASSGLSVDDKNKNAEYTQFAQLYLQEWQEFLSQKKVELNAQEAWGTVDSSYINGRI